MKQSKSQSQKSKYSYKLYLLAIFLCIISLLVGFLFGDLFKQKSIQKYLNTSMQSVPDSMLPGGGTPIPAVGSQADSQYNDSRIEIHSSPDGSRAFYTFIYNKNSPLVPINSDNNLVCSYGLTTGRYNNTDQSVFSLVGKDTLTCSRGDGYIEDGFKKWLNSQIFVLQTEKGVLEIIDVVKKTSQTYSFNPAWNFIDMTQDGKYFLFETKPREAYTLLDQNHKIINDKLIFPSLDTSGSLPLKTFGQPEVIYDPINNGFLFATYEVVSTIREDNYPWSNTSKKYDFYSMNDLSYRTLLITDPYKVGGHGCAPFHISSTLGEIIVDGGCPAGDLDSKYLSSDHFLHLRL